jgi:dolichyl-phosphate-mannose-protein mannosyltransferase
MSSPAPALKQRKGDKQKGRSSTPQPDSLTNGSASTSTSDALEGLKQSAEKAVKSEWDYKLAFAVITALAFVTRFWGIGHPDQVVFDEVHFGKVRYQIRFLHVD